MYSEKYANTIYSNKIKVYFYNKNSGLCYYFVSLSSLDKE